MAQTALKGLAWLPTPPPLPTPPAIGTTTLSVSGAKVAWIFQAPKAGTLDKVEFLMSAFTQATNGLRVSFQDRSLTNGAPDGTQDQYRDVTTGMAANTWIAPGLMTADGTDGGAKRTVTKGEKLCAVVEFVSFAASDSVGIGRVTGDASQPFAGFPYTLIHNGSSWQKTSTAHFILALKYDDGTYAMLGPSYFPISALGATTAFSNATTVKQQGVRFKVPTPVTVDGFWIFAELDGDVEFVLYDSDDATALETLAHDKDERADASTCGHFFRFATERVLSADTFYRLVVKPSSTTTCTLYYVDFTSTSVMAGSPGFGADAYYTQCELATPTGTGDWADTTTRRPWVAIGISGTDAGGSSSVTNVVGDLPMLHALPMKQSEATAARRRLLLRLFDATTGVAKTGVTVSAGDLKLSKNGGAEANHAGTLTEVGTGQYYYEATAGELDTLGWLAVRVAKSGVKADVYQIPVVAYDPFDTVRLGLTTLSSRARPTGSVVSDASNAAGTFEVTTTLSEATDDLKQMYLKFTSGANIDLVRRITGYNTTSNFVTVSEAFPATPSAADTFELING